MIETAVVAVAILLALSVVATALPKKPGSSVFIYGASAAFCAVLAIVGFAFLAAPASPVGVVLPIGLPWLGAHLRIDAVSSVFLLLLGIGGTGASLFAIGYGRHEPQPHRTLPFYPGFLGAMAIVVMANDTFTFLLSWEIMSLLSWALVLTHHSAQETRRSSYIYLTMAGFGTMTLLLAFGLLAGSAGDYDFAAIRAATRTEPTAAVILLLMLIGAGSKAGLMPLHVWLPVAHPAAPSHVSALMSGVMTKVAIYGFVRVVFDLLGPVPWWITPLVILVGAVTAVMGILHAINDNDSKRILAWSTIENIGVIFAGLGLALAFESSDLPGLAALTMMAALVHSMNHMLFKSLLFMVAGAVLNATERRDLDALGGLIHRMPITAIMALVGATAISALPPLNGFVSEWLLFQSVLQSPQLPQPALQFLVPAAGGILALTAALAAAAFVRFYGIIFLGRPRSTAAETAAEVDRWSIGAMTGLAALCVLAGVLPGLLIDFVAPAVKIVTGGELAAQAGNAWLTLVPLPQVDSSYSGFLVLAFIAISGGATAWIVHRIASRRVRLGPAWDCGFPNSDPITQYGAGSFAQPLRRTFGPVLVARESVTMPAPGDSAPARHQASTRDLAWYAVYEPLVAAVNNLAVRANALQFLSIRRYLSLVFGALILLLVGLAIWN